MPTKNKKKYVKAAKWFFVIVIAILGLIIGGLHIASRHFEKTWIERLPDIRLEPSRPHLDDRDVTPDNAYYYIRQLTNFVAEAYSREIRDEIDRFRQDIRGEKEYPLLHDWEVNNAERLALLRQIQATPHSQVASPDSIYFLIPYITDVLATTRLLAYLIERDVRNGDWDSAWDRFVLGVEVCDRIMPGGGLINHLVAHAGRNLLRNSLRREVWRNPPTSELTGDMIDYLLRMPGWVEPFVEAMRYEYVLAMHATDLVFRDPRQLQLVSGDISEDRSPMTGVRRMLARARMAVLGSTPAQTRRHIDAVYSQLIAAVEEGRVNEFEAMFERTYMDRSSLGLGFYVNDPIGRILIALLIPSVGKAHHRAIHSEMDAEATAAVVALARYRADHGGHLPDRMDRLVPDYLPRLPRDLYRPDQPLIYRVEGDDFRLYSVGPNGIDHGGEHHYFGADVDVQSVSDLLFHFTD